LNPNELDLSFPTLNYGAKFHQILFKIATVGAMTDRQTDASDLIICPCYAIAKGQIIIKSRRTKMVTNAAAVVQVFLRYTNSTNGAKIFKTRKLCYRKDDRAMRAI